MICINLTLRILSGRNWLLRSREIRPLCGTGTDSASWVISYASSAASETQVRYFSGFIDCKLISMYSRFLIGTLWYNHFDHSVMSQTYFWTVCI